MQKQASSKQQEATDPRLTLIEYQDRFGTGQSSIPRLMNFDDAWFARSQVTVRLAPNRLSMAVAVAGWVLGMAGVGAMLGMAVLWLGACL